MSKKNKDMFDVKLSDMKADGTLLEQFHSYIAEHGRKVSTIIDFLHWENARYLVLLAKHKDPRNLEEKDKMEILEFCNEFDEVYNDVTYDARMREWNGDEPIIIRIGEVIREEMLIRKQKKELETVPEKIIEEAKLVADRIWNIRENRFLSFVLGDGHGNQISESLYIAKKEPKKALDDIYTYLLYDCVAMLMSYGSLVLRIVTEDEKSYLVGFATNYDNTWKYISAEEMRDAHTLCPDGSRMEPEDDEFFIDLDTLEVFLSK